MFSGSYNDLTNKPTLFSGSYNDLTNKPTIPTFTVSLINPSGTITEQTTNVKALRFDTESAFDLTDLGNGEVKVQMNSTFKYWKVDGQQDLIATGLDTIRFEAGPGITITTDPNASPYQTLRIRGFSGNYNDLTNKPEQFKFNVAADDSVTRTISADETIKISGTQGISTSTDPEGNITIEGPDLPDLPSVDIDTGIPIPVGYVLKWNGTKWAPAIDNTSETAGSLQVYDEGSTHFTNINTMNFKGTGVTVTSSVSNSVDVNINTDFIGFNIDGGHPETIYGGINPIDAGHI